MFLSFQSRSTDSLPSARIKLTRSKILAAAQPQLGVDGHIRTIMGSITDITLQKRASKDSEARARLSEQLLLRTQETEVLQKQRLVEAEETRRQQNNFIDITSHEMRNPLVIYNP